MIYFNDNNDSNSRKTDRMESNRIVKCVSFLWFPLFGNLR